MEYIVKYQGHFFGGGLGRRRVMKYILGLCRGGWWVMKVIFGVRLDGVVGYDIELLVYKVEISMIIIHLNRKLKLSIQIIKNNQTLQLNTLKIWIKLKTYFQLIPF